ncbi:MAG: glycosyl transferase [Clostridia bacterium]|nr:glycosyl transferase [Clostridia bacterium]
MNILKKGIKYVTDRDYRWIVNSNLGFYNSMDDEKYVKEKYRACFGVYPDLENPKGYVEKLQWLKLYYHNPKMTVCCDKYLVRDYIKEVIGEEYLIPLLGVYDSPDEIDFDALPDRFVLKCNHNSGKGMYICKDKSKMDVEKVKAGLRKGLKEDYFLTGREWCYKNVPRKIICEEYMEDSNGEFNDYKFYCNHGKAKDTLICFDRFKSTHKNLHMSENWEIMPYNSSCEKAIEDGLTVPVPENYEEMKSIAEKLSQGFPHVRMDMYDVDGRIYFGEFTFYSDSGYFRWLNGGDDFMGSDLILPEKMK